jgi:hypothetical protein
VALSAACAPAVGRAIDAGHGALLLGGGAALGAAMTLALSRAESRAGYLLAWAGIGAAQSACLYEACFAVVTINNSDWNQPGEP